MIWNINCRKIRRLLALSAGNDLEQRECQAAERHLAVCPACRDVWERLQQSQQVLERVRPAPFEEVERAGSIWPVSVWPNVARHIHSMDEPVVTSNWRNWLPAGAMAAACVAIISVTLPELPVEDGASPAVVMSSPANFDPNHRDTGARDMGARNMGLRHLGPFPLGLHREGDLRRNERATNVDSVNPDDDWPSF
jgi:hypothetical protein